MSAKAGKMLEQSIVFLILGTFLTIASFAVGYLIVFADAAIVPLGNLGKFIIVVVTLTLNGLLVVIIAEQRKKVSGVVNKITP